MKQYLLILLSISLGNFYSCTEVTDKKFSSLDPIDWNSRSWNREIDSSFISGKTYLSVYSEIFMYSDQRTNTLTSTISMRNVYEEDTLIINSAKYYNTKGELIRSYFDKPIYIAPLETVNIVVDEDDLEGGTGANFIFDWLSHKSFPEPYFDAVMISYGSGQGVSFTSHGIKMK